MKAAALLTCFLLSVCGAAAAATPDDLWQEYQKHPDYVSTQPRSPAPNSAPHVTVEDKKGHASEPTTPQQAKEKSVVTREAQTTAQSKKQATAAPAADKAQPAPQANPAKGKALPSLVKKPPLPRQYLRTPQTGDFAAAASEAGAYSLKLPKVFGSDPLAQLPQAQDAMLVRTADNTLMCAATVLDPTDNISYQAQQPLPSYEGKKPYARWQHGAELIWDCVMSRHGDFYGDKVLLEATAKQNGKTYQLLYVMPLAQLRLYLPQALYSLDSFALKAADKH